MDLIVIGNGFDLSHNLKTSYKDYLSFVRENANDKNGWGLILEYYPEDHEYWSDIEKNICVFELKPFYLRKKYFGTGFLSDLLKMIYDSFGMFIEKQENEIEKIERKFHLTNDSLYLTFNYTTVLEKVYKISDDNIIHIHNSIEEYEASKLFNVSDWKLILGHGGFEDTPFYDNGLISNDREYARFLRDTRKKFNENIKEKHLDYGIMNNITAIDRVIFFGLSLSPTDKIYYQYLKLHLNCKFIVMYHVSKNNDEKKIIEQYKYNINKSGMDSEDFIFINDEYFESVLANEINITSI